MRRLRVECCPLPHGRGSAHRGRGFTLLELLLCMGITCMLALTLYASMRVGLQARRSANEAVAPVRASSIAIDMICHDLESILPPTGLLAGPFLGVPQTGPTGQADALEFYCLGSDGQDPRFPVIEGVRKVNLVLRTDVSPQVLVRRVTRNLLAGTQVEPEEEILCRGVRSFSLQYFDGSSWLSQWDSTSLDDVLPFAVQVCVEMEAGVPSVAGGSGSVNRVVRIVPLACAKLNESAGTNETSNLASSSGAGTGGGR